jgi:magnesium transporter
VKPAKHTAAAQRLDLRAERLGDLLGETLRVETDHETVGGFLARARGDPSAAPAWVAVCREDRLVGLVAAGRILTADPQARLADLTEPAPITAQASSSLERTAWLAAHRGADVVAVEDEDGRFAGLIPTARFLPLLVHEHELDLANLGGFLRNTSVARTASEEPLLRRVLHRSPWLLIGLLGAVAAAQIVSSFESELERTVALAFFLPGIVYMADAVGTQTETLVIRGLSVGVSIRSIFRLEAITGAVVGLILSAAIYPFAFLMTGEANLALVVAISLMAASTCATLVAMALPVLMTRYRVDPAFGSGPLATVVQDLLSILVYFGVAMLLV